MFEVIRRARSRLAQRLWLTEYACRERIEVDLQAKRYWRCAGRCVLLLLLQRMEGC